MYIISILYVWDIIRPVSKNKECLQLVRCKQTTIVTECLVRQIAVLPRLVYLPNYSVPSESEIKTSLDLLAKIRKLCT